MAAERLKRRANYTEADRVKALEEIYDIVSEDKEIYSIVQATSKYGTTKDTYFNTIGRTYDSNPDVKFLMDAIRDEIEARLVVVGLTKATAQLNAAKSMFVLKANYGYRDIVDKAEVVATAPVFVAPMKREYVTPAVVESVVQTHNVVASTTTAGTEVRIPKKVKE